jgi:class 3 adenylate cyclase
MARKSTTIRPSGREALGPVMIVDMTGFSNRPTDAQERLVQKMWDAVSKHPVMRKDVRPLTNCTGDGGLFAWPGRVNPLSVLQFGRDLIDAMNAGKSDEVCGLRVAIHQGRFAAMRPQPFKQDQAIGSAPNQCARLVPFSDNGTIVVSEDFVLYWEETQGADAVHDRFVPDVKKDPISVFVKHNVEQRIRIYRGDKSAAAVGMPKRIRSLQLIEDRIRLELSDIVDVLLGILHENKITLDPQRAVPRVSIFVKDPKLPFLNPTKYRFITDPNAAGAQRGKTRYPTTGEGAGCPGMCFVAGKAVAVNALPNPAKAKARYLKETAERLHLTEDDVAQFQRHAQSLGSFPVRLGEEPIDGVVCIDLLDPLAKLNQDGWAQVVQIIEQTFSDHLAQLLRLRL